MKQFWMALVACLIATGLFAKAEAKCLPRTACAEKKDKLAPPPADAREACKRMFAQGANLHETGQYEEAAKEFEAAYRWPNCGQPAFLFNAGMSHFRICRNTCRVEECTKAKELFRSYLAKVPGDAEAQKYCANAKSVATACAGRYEPAPEQVAREVAPGPRGEQGEPGPMGPQGPKGDPGRDGVVHVDDTEARAAAELAQKAANMAVSQFGAANAARKEAQKSAEIAVKAADTAVEAAKHHLVLSLGPLVGATGLTNGTNAASSIGGGLALEFRGEHGFLSGDLMAGYCGALSIGGTLGLGYGWDNGFRLGVAGVGESCVDTSAKGEELAKSRLLGGGLNIGFRASSGFFISALLGAGAESHPIEGGRETEAVGLGQLRIGFLFDLN